MEQRPLTLNTIPKKDIRKVIISYEQAEIFYCDGVVIKVEFPYPYDSNYISWMASAVWYYTGTANPPVSGRKHDSYKNLMAMRDEFIASALVVSKETFHILELFPKSITEAAFRGVDVHLQLVIFHLTGDELEEEKYLTDYDFPRHAIKQRAPQTHQAVRLETDQIFFQNILTDHTRLARLLYPSGIVFLNIELYENTIGFFKDFFKHFTVLLKLAKYIKADFQITEDQHGTTFRECAKGLEDELAQYGVRFVDLFDKVARISMESAVTDKLRLVLLQAPSCDMIRIRMPISDIVEILPVEAFAEDKLDKSIVWPNYFKTEDRAE